MKLKLLFIITIALFSLNEIKAQGVYGSSSGEVILSFSNAAYHNNPNAGDYRQVSDAPRFTIWFHTTSYLNFDMSEHFGIYSGLSLRNIGLITMEPSSNPNVTGDVKWKRRSYSLGIPLAFKLGKLDNGFYLFAGGQYEWLFHYKEKEFLNSGKRKYTEWFSSRVNSFLPSVFVGMAFPGGMSLKFTYAMDDFMNKNYSYQDNSGNLIKPYENMDSKIFYISLFMNAKWDEYLEESQTRIKKIAAL